jgi:hypothetical protein
LSVCVKNLEKIAKKVKGTLTALAMTTSCSRVGGTSN